MVRVIVFMPTCPVLPKTKSFMINNPTGRSWVEHHVYGENPIIFVLTLPLPLYGIPPPVGISII